MNDENTCRSCKQEGKKLVCTTGKECTAMSNPEYESWLQVSAGAANSHATQAPRWCDFVAEERRKVLAATAAQLRAWYQEHSPQSLQPDAAHGVGGCSFCYDGGCADPLGCGETDVGINPAKFSQNPAPTEEG